MSMRRWMSWLLALCMVISMLPAGVLAVEWEAPQQEEPQIQPEQVQQERPAQTNEDEEERRVYLDEPVTATIKKGYGAEYAFTPEVDGWYYMLIPADGKGWASVSLGPNHFAYGPYRLDDEHDYVIVGPLDAGVTYRLSMTNLSDLDEYTMTVSIHKCNPGNSLEFNLDDSLAVGQRIELYYHFETLLNYESIEVTLSDPSILEVDTDHFQYLYLRALKAGTVTITMSTPSGLSCSKTITVSEPIPMELGGTAELTIEPDGTGYISFTAEEEGWFVLQTDNRDYLQYSVVSDFAYNLLAIYSDYIKVSPGYTVVRLTNSGSEQETCHLRLEKAQKPTVINMQDVTIGVGTAFSVDVAFDSYWHFADLVWSIEGDAVVIDGGEYFCCLSAVKEGTAVLTASTLDGTVTGSCTITVLGAQTLEIGVVNTVILPAYTTTNCVIEPEKSGFYMIDIEYEYMDYSIYAQTDDGLEYVSTECDIVYLEAGKTYAVRITAYGHSETITTNVSILEATPMELDSTVTIFDRNMLYSVTVEQSGTYVFEAFEQDYDIVMYQSVDGQLEWLPMDKHVIEGWNHHVVELTAGETYYLLFCPNGNTVELTFHACESAEEFYLLYSTNTAVVGSTYWIAARFYDYRKGNVTYSFSEEGILELNRIDSESYYFNCLKPGTVTITFTLENGYTNTITVTAVEPTVLTLDEQIQVEAEYNRTQYFTFIAPEDGYYVWYIGDGAYVSHDVNHGKSGDLFDEEGNCYVYLSLSAGEMTVLSVSNWNYDRTIQLQTKIVKAKTPTSLTLPEKIQPVSDCSYWITVQFGSPWEYGRINWTDTLEWEYRYFDGANCCIDGPVTTGSITATWYGENDTVLTATCIVEIIEPPVIGCGELKTVELPGNSGTAFTFVPEVTAAYHVSSNHNVNIYRVTEYGREYVYSYGSESARFYDLEAGETYQIETSNSGNSTLLISLCVDLPREVGLDVPVNIDLARGMEKVLTLQVLEEGLYRFSLDRGLIRLYISDGDHWWGYYNDDEDQENVFSHYMYPGTYTLEIAADTNYTGTLTITMEKPEKIELELDKPVTFTVDSGDMKKFTFDGSRFGAGVYVLSFNTYAVSEIDGWGALENGAQGRYYIFAVGATECAEWVLQFDFETAQEVTAVVTRAELPEELLLSNTKLTLTVGQNASLAVNFLPGGTWDDSLVWTSSDPDVAVVDGWGAEASVTAKSAGTAYITVTGQNGLTAVCEVTVEPIKPVAELALNEYTAYQMKHSGDFPIFSFTAPEAGEYFFALMSVEDAIIYVRDLGGNLLHENDDYFNLNSGLWMSLEAGETVFVEAKLWSNEAVVTLLAMVSTHDNVYHDHSEIYDDANAKVEDGYLVFTCPHCGATIVVPYTEEVIMMGDVNGDGEISVLDAMMVAQRIVGDISEEQLKMEAADVNGDGEISVLDAMLIAQFIVGDITDFG